MAPGRPADVWAQGEAYERYMGRWSRRVAETFATPKPLNVPTWLMRAHPYAHRMVTANTRVSGAKAKAKVELGWTPGHPGCAEGLRALARGRTPAGRAGSARGGAPGRPAPS
ncbi:hypothetical protein [Streptomyces sp. NPDC090021]|uniref:hypothetical protein n=1 Tax=Streptomyces sp. NPDC090021 TaxID=3365919 RepID=UPI00382E7F01